MNAPPLLESSAEAYSQLAHGRFELRLAELDADGFCPLHGDRLDGAGDCVSCYIDYDAWMRRVEDL